MIKLKAPAGVLSACVAGATIKVVDGFAEVDAALISELKSHGFVDPNEAPEAAPLVTTQQPAGDVVAIPRSAFMAALKDLGVALADNLPASVLTQALGEAAAQQGARIQHEVGLVKAEYEKRIAEDGARYDAAKADIEKDAETRLTTAVETAKAALNAEWEAKLAALGHAAA